MTWLTYTPDGRELEIELTDGGWRAKCGGTSALAPTAAEAIRSALGDGSARIGVDASSVESWIAENAASIERDAETISRP